tara:strand:- start:2016 stop:2477 length:462 start_codon:yes stop_codon:yes gene_type:complete
MAKETKFKIPPRKIDSSDCIVHVGQKVEEGKIVDEGDAFKIHEGEWVKIVPYISMKESMALVNIANLSTDSGTDSLKSLQEMCSALSERIFDWNWTDNIGQPMPKPYKNPEVLMNLQNEELIWLVSVSMGETPTEKKTDMNNLQSSSLTQQSQ